MDPYTAGPTEKPPEREDELSVLPEDLARNLLERALGGGEPPPQPEESEAPEESEEMLLPTLSQGS